MGLMVDNETVPRTLLDPPPAPYWLYLLECEGGVYYAGIALDVEQRFFQHVFGLGARFTRGRPPVRVLAVREYPNKGDALRAEYRLKGLPRSEKLAFFEDIAESDLAPARDRRRGQARVADAADR
jgi:putative endonuclease